MVFSVFFDWFDYTSSDIMAVFSRDAFFFPFAYLFLEDDSVYGLWPKEEVGIRSRYSNRRC